VLLQAKTLRCWSMQAADSDRVMNMAYGWPLRQQVRSIYADARRL